MRRLVRSCATAAAGALVTIAAAQEPASNNAPPCVFDRPALQRAQEGITGSAMTLMRTARPADAEKLLLQAVAEARFANAMNYYNLACAQAAQGKTNAALSSLARSVKLGFRQRRALETDSDLKSLRGTEGYRAALAAAGETGAPAPSAQSAMYFLPVTNGVARVLETNVLWDSEGGFFLTFHAFPPADTNTPICMGGGVEGDLLRTWQAEGTAAGLHGFLYDNHDRGHSRMPAGRFPQLTVLEFGEAARKRGFDNGIQLAMLHSAPTIGNTSEAVTGGPYWGSLPRVALRPGASAMALFRQYITSHMYFYPEHMDHDADGHGDVFHANTPYVLISQGSSGSDQPFLYAIAATLAAYTPATQKRLVESRLLMPTTQMIFRRARKGIDTPDDYLSGRAHPSVFDAASLDTEKMVRMAHALKPDEIPPLVTLRVVEEDVNTVGVDYFDIGGAERVFDTPCAIARVVRATKKSHRMVVRADTGRKGMVMWRLLRGDPKRVSIRPLDEAGGRAEITVDWQERRPVEPGSALTSVRVDVGVFAHVGTQYSAPSFISWLFPANERREYDGTRRIASVEYLAPDGRESYVDPGLLTPAQWRDMYHYDGKGPLLGWTRTRVGGESQEFTRDGALVTARDAAGRAVAARTVRYLREQKDVNATPLLVQAQGDTVLSYEYASDKDRVGKIKSRTPAPADPAPPPP